MFRRKGRIISVPQHVPLDKMPKIRYVKYDIAVEQDDRLTIRGLQREQVVEYLLLMDDLARRILWWRLNNIPVDRIRCKLGFTRQWIEYLLKEATNELHEHFAD